MSVHGRFRNDVKHTEHSADRTSIRTKEWGFLNAEGMLFMWNGDVLTYLIQVVTQV